MKKDLSRSLTINLTLGIIAGYLLVGCNASNAPDPVPESVGTNPTIVSGYALPESIEVIPTESIQSAQAKESGAGFSSKVKMLNAIKSKDVSDFDKDEVHLSVNENSLEHFGIIDGILGALRQTRYADPQNINKGPYAALLKFDDNQGSTELEKWIVDSAMVVENGKSINRVRAWIDGVEDMVEVEFKIMEAASLINRYGRWQFHAKIIKKSNLEAGHFSAKIEKDLENNSIIYINAEGLGDRQDGNIKGKLILSSDEGQGIIQYPEYKYNDVDNSVTVDKMEARYAYNESHLVIDDKLLETGESVKSCKDRNNFEDLFLDYNVYDANGMNIRKSKTYGFSVKLEGEDDSSDKYYWYGAWNGRHVLHGRDELISLPVGTLLQSENRGEASTEYFFGAAYDGYLTSYSERESSLDEIKGHVFESRYNENSNFVFDANAGGWRKCSGPAGSWDCSSLEESLFDFNSLKPDAVLKKQSGFYGNINGVSLELSINTEGTGFTGTVPDDGDRAWGWMSHPLFLKYDQGVFLSYDYIFTDPEHWRYELGESVAFDFKKGKYELRTHDLKFILDYDPNGPVPFGVTREIEEVILPGEQAELLSNITFQDRFNEELSYTFDFLSMGMMDQQGDFVTQGLWHLLGSDGKEYSWSYANEESPWNRVSFLKDMEGKFVFLDKAVYFAPFEINGKSMSFLGYDGHVFGLPDFWTMLRESDGELTEEMRSQIVNIPVGEYFDREDAGIVYKIKPRHGYRILDNVSLNDCLAEIEGSLDLSGIPAFQDPEIGPLPQNVLLKVIEGEFL